MRVGFRLVCIALLQAAIIVTIDAKQADVAPDSNMQMTAFLWNKALQSSTLPEALVATAHESVCSKSSNSQQCEIAVETMVPVLVDWWNRRLFVEGIRFSALHHPNAATSRVGLQATSSADCALCKYAVSYVKTAIESQATKEAISQATQEACSELPSEFQDTCIDVVVRYEDLLLQYVQTTDPSTFCSSVGACKTSTLKPLVPHSIVAVLEKARPVSGGSFCGTCKMVVTEARTLVEDPNTQAEIMDFVKNTCQTVVPMFADICTQYVDEYAPAIFALLDEYLNEDLCTSLGFCVVEELDIDEEEDGELAALAIELEEAGSLDAEDSAEAKVRDQQEDMVAYVASLLVSQDIEAKTRGEAHVLRGSDRNVITAQLIRSLGLDSKPASKVDAKLPDWMTKESDLVASRKLLLQ